VLQHLSLAVVNLANLHLMPTCGTKYYRWFGDAWHEVYAEQLSESERNDAKLALMECAKKLGFWEVRTWGDVIEDRGSQVTFSALGQAAPLEAKSAWDPDGCKKSILRLFVAERLPHLEVRSGGSTSIDITQKGIDKAFGMRRLMENTKVSIDEVVFVGDRLAEGGNDYPVRAMGVRCIEVSSWVDTATFIENILAEIDALT
jgi:phosphomannomutase